MPFKTMIQGIVVSPLNNMKLQQTAEKQEIFLQIKLNHNQAI